MIPKIHINGGDAIIHSGDISSMGYEYEIKNFLDWFESLPYTYKIFIAGNHDFYFQDYPTKTKKLISQYKDVIYLEDDFVYIGEHPNIYKVYGTPWQPKFNNWAFNLPRSGTELKEVWGKIPNDVDILLTHCPPQNILDVANQHSGNLGCELLARRIEIVQPLIHNFGHIHGGYGYREKNGIHYINSSTMTEQYRLLNNPVTIVISNNEIEFI